MSHRFAGEVLVGDAWRGHDFTGQRVAVLAPGSAAARILPEVVRTAAAVKLFQEQPDWVLPRSAGPLRVVTRLPGGRRLVGGGLARAYLRLSVDDPWTRRRLTPDLRFDHRPAAVSSAFYAALQRPNCTLVTWPVYAIVSHGVRSAEGVEHHADCLVVAATSLFASPLRKASA